MFRADYHLHSKFSFDGKEEISDIIKAAVEANLDEICITDHLDIFKEVPDDEYDYNFDANACYSEIDNLRDLYKGKLNIKKGVELGQPFVNKASADLFYKNFSPDFIIGSVHNINDVDLYYYNWDYLDEYPVYYDYVELLIKMAKESDFDVMGHLTYPLRYIFEARNEPFYLGIYEDRFKELFKILIEKGKGIECNTSGFNQKLNDSMPPLSLLKLYKECGGEIITVGSDAHKKEFVGSVEKGYTLIKEAGFDYVSTYENRKVSFKKIQ